MATHDDTAPATKQDIQMIIDQMATKQDLGNTEKRMTAKIDALDSKLSKRLDAHDEQFQVVLSYMNDLHTEQRDYMDSRFDEVDQKFAAVDARFASIDERFDRLEDIIFARESNATKIRKIDKRVSKVEMYLGFGLDS